MAQKSPPNIEQVLYFSIFLLALALRTSGLGASPLNELEAQAALPAHALAQGGSPALGDQPGYVILTGILFSLLSSSDFLARLWPALFGCALVLLPYFWRDRLGRKAALLLSLALAIDPGMVAISRLASGRMLALAGALIALTACRYGRFALAGGFAAFAVLSNSSIYLGLSAALLAWLLFFRASILIERKAVQSASLEAGAILIFGGTLFFRAPQGLSGLGTVFSAFLQDWGLASDVSVVQVLLALLAYSLPALIFAILAAVRTWSRRESTEKTLSLFALFSFVIILVYPGRQVADLIWVLLPLWALAALEISRYLQVPQRERAAALGQAGLMLLLLIFLGQMLAKQSLADPGSELARFYLLLAGGVALLGAIATVLIAFGWSRQAAASGLVWALGLIFAIFLLSASMRFVRGAAATANDLWLPGPAAGQTRLLLSSLRDLTAWETGQLQELPVDLRLESAELRWELRNFPEEMLSEAGTAPALIVTLAEDSQPAEAISYRGQSFALEVERAWTGWPPNFFRWLLFRQAPTLTQQAILWARPDLFPDGDLSLQNETDAGSASDGP